MSFFNKIAGYGSMNNNIEHQISDYLLDDENVIMAFTFIRDSIVLTNYGIYTPCNIILQLGFLSIKYFAQSMMSNLSCQPIPM